MQSVQCLLPSEESITVVLRSLMESSIPFSFWVTWHRNKTYKTVVPCCSSIPLSLLGSIWSFMRNLVQHVKKSFGDQSQAKVPCPSNLRHMFKNNSLHFKWSSRSNFKFSRTPEKLFSFCSTSAQAKVCESECVFSSEQINCVQRLCIKSTQPILSLSTEPDWYDPKTSCLFAALLPFLPWKHMQSTPIHSVCHSICEGLLLGPYSAGRPMFLGSPQPSQQNHGKQSIPQSFSAALCCERIWSFMKCFLQLVKKSSMKARAKCLVHRTSAKKQKQVSTSMISAEISRKPEKFFAFCFTWWAGAGTVCQHGYSTVK